LVPFDRRGTGLSDPSSVAPVGGSAMSPALRAEFLDAIENRWGEDVRAGLHTGECELVGGDVAGIAVHIGARVVANAAAGEVLASSTVKDLVVGSGLHFSDRGLHALKGVPDRWPLYALER
jgi:class 3 adenylate cyclase